MNRDIFQGISFTLVLGVAIIQFMFLVKEDKNRVWYIPTLFWSLHTVIFYLFVLTGNTLPFITNSDWSALNRLHILISVFAIELTRFLSNMIDRKICYESVDR